MHIKYFALADWVECDLMILQRINTAINMADHFTKILDRTLFYRHVNFINGHIPPPYSPCHDSSAWNPQYVKNEGVTRDDLAIRPTAAAAAKCELSLDPWVNIVSHECISNPIWSLPTLNCGGC
jgi:hypothetical protein